MTKRFQKDFMDEMAKDVRDGRARIPDNSRGPRVTPKATPRPVPLLAMPTLYSMLSAHCDQIIASREVVELHVARDDYPSMASAVRLGEWLSPTGTRIVIYESGKAITTYIRGRKGWRRS